jgi:hypothetical protein
MAMSQGERIRRIQEENTVYISRMKVRDSSELTHIRRAQASGAVVPQSVSSVQDVAGCARNVQIEGKGTNMEYGSVLRGAENSAICGGVKETNPYLALGTYIPAPCYDRSKPPFAQQDLTVSTMVYVPPCTVSGSERYFPIINDTTCVYDRVITPSG